MNETTESATIQPVTDSAPSVPSAPSDLDTPAVPGLPDDIRHYRTENPLYDRLNRLTRRHRWWVMATVGLGLFVGVGQNFPSLASVVSTPPKALQPFIISLVLLFYVASLVSAIGSYLVPIVIAVAVASLTARETTADSYELVLLTDLTNRQIVNAYLRIGVKRTLPLWAFQLALTVPALIGPFLSPLVNGGNSSNELYYFNSAVYVVQTVISLLIRVPLLLLALTWGAWVAQRVRTSSGAIIGAVLGMFITQFIYSAVSTLLLILTAFNTDNYRVSGDVSSVGSGLSGSEIGFVLLSLVVALIVPLLAGILYVTLPARVPRRV